MLTVGIIVYGVDPHVPMLLGVMGAAIMAFILGYSREQIEGFMIKGISKAMQSIIILVIIGVLIGVWLDAGVVPGRMYSEEYKKMGLSPTSLSNALESSGTVSSALIPWNTCGVFIFSTLGISVTQYGPWAVFHWLMPIACFIMAFMGITVADSEGVRLCRIRKKHDQRIRLIQQTF